MNLKAKRRNKEVMEYTENQCVESEVIGIECWMKGMQRKCYWNEKERRERRKKLLEATKEGERELDIEDAEGRT